MKKTFSTVFLLMAVLFTVCLIASNLFATKIFVIGNVALPCAVLVFPLSYILNDCFTEVWGYKSARLVIWTAFAMNFFVVLAGWVAVWLPGASFWDGAPHFDYMFRMAPRVALASLLAFLAGSTLNAYVLSRMKIAQQGKAFSFRAILSSVAGELLDSLIFLPIAFWGASWADLGRMMLFQVSFKVLYELAVLPLTAHIVRVLKQREGVDAYDTGISYNPFRINDF